MRIDDWLRAATEDTARRGMPELAPLLESLARSTATLREADRVARAAAADATSSTGHLAQEDSR